MFFLMIVLLGVATAFDSPLRVSTSTNGSHSDLRLTEELKSLKTIQATLNSPYFQRDGTLNKTRANTDRRIQELIQLLAVYNTDDIQTNSNAERADSVKTILKINQYSYKAAIKYWSIHGFKYNIVYPSINAAMAMYMACSSALYKTERCLRLVHDSLEIFEPDESNLVEIKSLRKRFNNLTNIYFRMENTMEYENNSQLKEEFTVLKNYFGPSEGSLSDTFIRKSSHFTISMKDETDINENSLELTNRLILKAKWGSKIDSAQTTNSPFYSYTKKWVNIPTMYYYGTVGYRAFPDLNAKILKLDFEGNDASMFIIYPDSMKELAKLRNKLQNVTFKNLMTTPMITNHNSSVCLPKFFNQISGSYLHRARSKVDVISENRDSQNFTDSSHGGRFTLFNVDSYISLEINEEGATVGGKHWPQVSESRYLQRVHNCEYNVNRPFISLIMVNDVLICAAFISNPRTRY